MADQFKEPMNTGAREWDAETYDAVSDPQFEWGMEVLERLELRGDEVAVDAGCGSGRVTDELVDRLPNGRVIAVDGSAAMVEKAKERLGDRAAYLVSDLVELELREPVDLVFSTATFHWIPRPRRALPPDPRGAGAGRPPRRPVRRLRQRRRAHPGDRRGRPPILSTGST